MRVGEAEGDPEGDGRRTLANGWESRLWRLEDKHLREGSSVRQFERPRPLRIRHRRRRKKKTSLFRFFSKKKKIEFSTNFSCRFALPHSSIPCIAKIKRPLSVYFWEVLFASHYEYLTEEALQHGQTDSEIQRKPIQ